MIPKLLYETAQTIQETKAIWHEKNVRKVRKGKRTSGHMPENCEGQCGKDDRNTKVLVDCLRRLKYEEVQKRT